MSTVMRYCVYYTQFEIPMFMPFSQIPEYTSKEIYEIVKSGKIEAEFSGSFDSLDEARADMSSINCYTRLTGSWNRNYIVGTIAEIMAEEVEIDDDGDEDVRSINVVDFSAEPVRKSYNDLPAPKPEIRYYIGEPDGDNYCVDLVCAIEVAEEDGPCVGQKITVCVADSDEDDAPIRLLYTVTIEGENVYQIINGID